MTNLNISFDREIGPIKPMHGVGQPPFIGMQFDLFHYLTEAAIPYSRMHDVGNNYGCNQFVDIPNLFRNFDADETDPENYSFAFTDKLIEALMQAECPPVFRLGVTIENDHRLEMLRLAPPKDFAKWARICEHVVRHYNEGWANGYNYNIKYWEIWNEPENGCTPETNQMWYGTKEEYFELYATTASHLKRCFGDRIRVGGYGACGFYAVLPEPEKYGLDLPPIRTDLLESDSFMEHSRYCIDYMEDFLDFVKTRALPLDFFSWHSYAGVQETERIADFLRARLIAHGFSNLETHLNEWNTDPSLPMRGTAQAAANAAAMLCAMQNKKNVDLLCYYDARLGPSIYGGMFNPLTWGPLSPYYAFVAFGKLYRMGTQCAVQGLGDNLYAVAARGNGKCGLLVVYLGPETEHIKTDLSAMRCLRLDTCIPGLVPDTRKADDFVIRNNEVLYFEAEE